MTAGRCLSKRVIKTLCCFFIVSSIFISSALSVLAHDSGYYTIDKKLMDMIVVVVFLTAVLIIVLLYLIYQYKKTAKKLLKSRERYRLLMECLPNALIVHRDGIVEYINQAGIKLLGYNACYELVGKHLLEFVDPQYREIIRQGIQSVQEKEGVIPVAEVKFLRSNNEKIDVESTVMGLPDAENNIILSILKDITSRRQLKEALELDRLKTEFLSNISHELRTPLNVMLSSIQLCELRLKNIGTSPKKDNMMRYMDVMKQNCFRLLRLFNNLIDVTRIKSGNYEVCMKNYDIVNIVEEITLAAANFVRDKGINIIFDTDVEEKGMACDPDIIERIVLNLISNAVKFSKLGSTITVSVYDRADTVLISVKDEGIGIPVHKTREIFEHFKQAESLYTRECEGSGIGLSIVKSLTEMHGGSVFLHSEYGKGSEFIIQLPANKLPDGNTGSITDWNVKKHDCIERIKLEFSDIYNLKYPA